MPLTNCAGMGQSVPFATAYRNIVFNCGYAAFVLAAARIGFDSEGKKQWAIFGVFCGLAMGTKYTGLLAAPALAVCCAFVLLNRDKLKRNIEIRNLWVGCRCYGGVAFLSSQLDS